MLLSGPRLAERSIIDRMFKDNTSREIFEDKNKNSKKL